MVESPKKVKSHTKDFFPFMPIREFGKSRFVKIPIWARMVEQINSVDLIAKNFPTVNYALGAQAPCHHGWRCLLSMKIKKPNYWARSWWTCTTIELISRNFVHAIMLGSSHLVNGSFRTNLNWFNQMETFDDHARNCVICTNKFLPSRQSSGILHTKQQGIARKREMTFR